jgi:hypothetical protein
MFMRITPKIALLPFSFLVIVRFYFQLFEYDIDDWMDYIFRKYLKRVIVWEVHFIINIYMYIYLYKIILGIIV